MLSPNTPAAALSGRLRAVSHRRAAAPAADGSGDRRTGLCARAPASDGWAPPLDHTTLERHKGGWGQPDCTYFDTPRSWWDQLKARGVNWGTKELLMKQANALMELYGEKRRRDSVAASVCSCTIWGLRGEWHGVACGCPA
eukprot:gene20927-4902_t